MPRAFEAQVNTTNANTNRGPSGPFESIAKYDAGKNKKIYLNHTVSSGVHPNDSTSALPPPGTQAGERERDDETMRKLYEQSRLNYGQYPMAAYDDACHHHMKKTQKDSKPIPPNHYTTMTTIPPLPLWGVAKHIPNAVTLAGLVCGLLALRECAMGRGGNCVSAAWLIMLCYYMDVLDGGLARVLNATSPIGATLDDVADFVCHGVAPIGLLVCMNTPTQDTVMGKLSEVSWPIIGLCATLGFLAMCRTTHLYATKSTNSSGLYYHGLPTTYVGPGIATMYVLTESPTIANWTAVGLTILLLPLQTRVAEGMLESQAWKRWAFLTSLGLSLTGFKIGALCTLVMLALYTFYPQCFEWDQRYPMRLTGEWATKFSTGSLWRQMCGAFAGVKDNASKLAKSVSKKI